MKLRTCNHVFCKNCLKTMTDNEFKNKKMNDKCPYCRVEFKFLDTIKEEQLLKELKSIFINCDCGETMLLNEYNKHSEKCTNQIKDINKIIEQTKKNICKDKVAVNRNTFDCTICNEKNFSREGLIKHFEKYHCKSRAVCPICVKQPWGDPNYLTNVYDHLKLRHRFDYDTTVDYNKEEDEVLKQVLIASINDK